MNPIDDGALDQLLNEDAPFGDLTTRMMALEGVAAEATFSARGDMVASGLAHAVRLFERAGARAQALAHDGDRVPAGERLLQAQGKAGPVLLAWKMAQTLAEGMSGIAGATRRLVDLAGIPVACTRKNFPGTRCFAAQAVAHGGGVMHRLGLSETLLVFPEHLAFVPEAERAQRIHRLRRAQPEKRLVIEVGCRDDALQAARWGADVLQLERFSPAQLQDLVRALAGVVPAGHRRPRLAPAGGVDAANAAAYTQAGADFLVTSAPYLAPPADIRVQIGPPSTRTA